MPTRLGRRQPDVAGDPFVELLPPEPIGTTDPVADLERTTAVARWLDDTAVPVADLERTTAVARWLDEALGRDIERPALRAPAAPLGPGPRRQELQVFRQLWLPVDEVVSYLAAAPGRPARRHRPRLDCAYADLHRQPDRPLWTAEGRLRPRWDVTGIRVRLSIYGLAGPRTVLDLVPLIAHGRLRSRRFARAGVGVLEALREELRRAMPERAAPRNP
jgi:hypothetical protein